jgi:hypothetical protein
MYMTDTISLTVFEERLEAECVAQPLSNLALSSSADILSISIEPPTIGAVDAGPTVMAGEPVNGSEMPDSVESTCSSTEPGPSTPSAGVPASPNAPAIDLASISSAAPLASVPLVDSSLPAQISVATGSEVATGLGTSSEGNPEARREQLGLTPDLLNPPRHRGRRQHAIAPP